MKIGLVDIDGHAKKKKWGATVYPNIALCKISRWHKEHGDTVEWVNGFEHYDRIYMSKVFNFSPDDLTMYDADEIIRGGTGYDIQSRLPDNPHRPIPQWQKDMACWVNKKAHFVAHSFEEFEPRKGFRCREYFTETT